MKYILSRKRMINITLDEFDEMNRFKKLKKKNHTKYTHRETDTRNDEIKI